MSTGPAAMMDRGDSYRVSFLGSTMLHQGATGVGALQKPLREMYFTWRRGAGPPPALKECRVQMTSDGMSVSRRDTPDVHYSMADMLLWDAVQFIVVRDKKKMMCAFEPLDNDHSRNKDNLFAALDKKLHYLQPLSHPAMFISVVRRTAGIKALDVHVFVCGSQDEAMGLVVALKQVHACYNNQQAADTGLFGYSPFQQQQQQQKKQQQQQQQLPPAGTSIAHTRHSISSSAQSSGGGGALQRPAALDLATSVPVTKRKGVCLLTQEHFTGSQLNLASTSSPVASAQISRCSSVQALPTSSSIAVQDNISPTKTPNSSSHTNSLSSTQSHSFSSSHAGSLGSPFHRQLATALSSPPDSGFNSAAGDTTEDNSSTRGSSKGSAKKKHKDKKDKKDKNKEKEKYNSKEKEKYNSKEKDKYNSKDKDKSKDKKSKKDSKQAIVKPLPQEPREGTGEDEEVQEIIPKKGKNLVKVLPTPSGVKLGEGYSLLSGSGGALPGHIPPRPRSYSPLQNPEETYQRTLPREPDLDYDYDVDIGMFEQRQPLRPSGGGSVAPRSPASSQKSTASHFPRHQLRPPKSPGYLDRPPVIPKRERHDSLQSDYSTQDSNYNPPVLRPVAKVPPHKVTGIQVLPSRYTPDSPTKPSSQSPISMEQLSMEQLGGYKQGNDYDYSPPPLRKKYEDNWQFRPTPGGSRDYERPPQTSLDRNRVQPQPLRPAKYGRDPSGGSNVPNNIPGNIPQGGKEGDQMGEKLLLNQKKDAEIASVMQNLHFEYPDQRTLTPGAPGGMNFERALGYFP